METIDRTEFNKKYPNLSRELKGEKRVPIQGVRSNSKEAEKVPKKFDRYEPTVIDFLRRCETCEQGIEIIDYLASKGEIEEGYSKSLKKQLEKDGIESFGTKKEQGYYLLR